ncbi:MAG: hypothetical protein JWO44_1638 [Bacteroidetes bacterium]|nr:hypothetical protein [Bacteroidota bacterium]
MNLKIFGHPSCVTGIEVILQGNDAWTYNVVMLRKSGNKITIGKQQEEIKSTEALKAFIDKKAPLILSLTGKGIIHKKIVGAGEDASIDSLLSKALPGATTKEFCIQLAQASSGEAFISVVRTSILENVLADLSKNGINAISECYLGPFAINNTIEQFGFNDQLLISGQSISIENNVIKTIVPSAEVSLPGLQIGNEHLSPGLIIAFSSAFSCFSPAQKGIENSETLNGLKEEFRAKRKFERTGVTSLVILFLLLLVNYFVFSSYRAKNNELKAAYTLNESAIEQYDTLRKELAFKKKFLEDNGLLKHSKTSFYADELAKDLPAAICWSALRINPLKTIKNSEENVFAFENHMIDINGKCDQSAELNQWMKQVQHYPWVKDVLLINYTQSQKNEPGVFLLRLIIK